MLHGINGKRFDDLDPQLQGKIEDYQLTAYIIQPPTPERVKFDIFDRVNRGGTQLNNQEMRNALYQGHSTLLLDKLSDSKAFKKVTGNSIKSTRMKDKYIISRFIGFYLLKNYKLDFKYKSDIDDFLGKVMEYLNSFSSYEEITYLENIFENAMNNAYRIIGQNVFRFETKNYNRRPLSMGLFEAISYLFTIIADPETLGKNLLKQKICDLKIEFDSSGTFSNKVDNSKSVQYRFERVEELKETL
jgi:hypothetical protein